MKLTYEKVADWLIPCLLGAAVYSLTEIRKELSSMSISLAVAVSKIDDHERRLQQLEAEHYNEPPRRVP